MAKIQIFSEETGYVHEVEASSIEKAAITSEINLAELAGQRLAFINFESREVKFARVACVLEEY